MSSTPLFIPENDVNYEGTQSRENNCGLEKRHAIKITRHKGPYQGFGGHRLACWTDVVVVVITSAS